MSSHYRAQIKLLVDEASEILNNVKTFPVPARPPGQSDTGFRNAITPLLKSIEDENNEIMLTLEALNEASASWMNLRTNMTGAERNADTPIYDNFVAETPYPQTIANLRRYQKTIRSQQRALEAAMPARPNDQLNPLPRNPPAPTAPSLIHLPKTELPKFTGECTEYTSFWNSFKSGVHDLPLSDSIKFTYLKQCLQGPPFSLICSLPVTDASYQSALDLLSKHYDNPEEVSRALHNSLRKFTRVRSGDSFCDELRSLVDQIECFCIQMSQQNLPYNTVAVQMEIEERLPRFVLDEIFMAKESDDAWSTDKLKNRLRAILKRKEQIQSLQKTTPSSKFKPISSPQYSFSPPVSSLTFATQGTTPNQNPPQSHNSVRPKLPCLFCDNPQHFSNLCPQFPDTKSRSDRLKTLRRCFKCLKNGHFSSQCPNPSRCSNCRGPHPRALCPEPPLRDRPQTHYSQSSHPAPQQFCTDTDPNQSTIEPAQTNSIHTYPRRMPNNVVIPGLVPTPLFPNIANDETEPHSQTNSSTVSYVQNNPLPILLKCVRVTFFNPNNHSLSREGILLLDDGSTNTYIQLGEAKQLNLVLSPSKIRLGTFGDPQCKFVPTYTTQFGIRLMNGRSLMVRANTTPHLTQPTPYVPFTPELFSFTDLVPQARNVFPVILLGSDYYYDLEPVPVKRLPTGYHVIQTLLGPLVAGKPFLPLHSSTTQTINFSTQEPLLTPPHDFFTLEGIGIKDSPQSSPNDDDVLVQFNNDIELVHGRYQIKFPFKSEPSTLPLPSNFGLCWGRLRSVLATLSKDPSLLQRYDGIIQDQLERGVIEPVHRPQVFSPPLHYLPHHPVLTPAKNKVRIVYDGSAHTNREIPLNHCLHPGPIILTDLVGLLLRFRIPKIAITCDIEKAFLQVSVHPAHRDCTRFLWLKKPSEPLSTANVQIYRFCRVSFGLTCSPFLLAATIKYHLSKHPSPLSQEIITNIYVDNLLLSADNPSEGRSKSIDAIATLYEAGMPLREFVSNCPEALSHLAADRRLPGTEQSFLGIGWKTDSDELKVSLAPPPPLFEPTRRSILSYIPSNYDPLGLISPVLLPLKIFLQSLCQEGCDWDQSLPPQFIKTWSDNLKQWSQTQTIFIPRCPLSSPITTGHTFCLHCFTDASNSAMCTAVFLQVNCPPNSSKTTIVFAKTKVKPSHKSIRLTIPRLELIAVEMGSRALTFVQAQLSNIKLQPILNLWTDSAIVLAWLNADSPIREIFVENRLKPIRSVPNLIIRHLPGIENPADIGTRGVPCLDALKSLDLWWSGPVWLSLPPAHWPTNSEIKPFSSAEYFSRPPKPVSPTPIFTFHIEQSTEPIFDLTRFSRLPKLLRSVAYVNRFLSRIKSIPEPHHRSLSVSLTEIRHSLMFIVRHEQTEFPPSEQENESLGLFMDPQGIIRARGRLGKSNLPISATEPIFMSPKSNLTQLIVYEMHILNHHSSALHTLSQIRRQFWIPKGRRTVARILEKLCLPCRRFTALPFDLPKFPPLPVTRVQISPPFTAVGLDYCGPVHVKLFTPYPPKSDKTLLNPQTTKYWILVWVCLSTRALSLDLVHDQSAATFLMAFRRFQAKYGQPSTIHCDNAPTFITFSKFLTLTNQINWKFRPPAAAWVGGHYERFMSHIKFHLRRALSTGLLPHVFPHDNILTILAEIETVINSRPISFDSADPADPRPLRPIDFIRPIGVKPSFPFSALNDDPLDPAFTTKPSTQSLLTERWETQSRNTQKFWKKWKNDYLLSLRERFKKVNISNKRWPRIGELVIVQSDTLPRSLWILAIILDITNTESNLPHTVKLKFLSGHISTRSVHHVYPLETTEESQSDEAKHLAVPALTKQPLVAPHCNADNDQVRPFPTTSAPTHSSSSQSEKHNGAPKWNWAKAPPKPPGKLQHNAIPGTVNREPPPTKPRKWNWAPYPPGANTLAL